MHIAHTGDTPGTPGFGDQGGLCHWTHQETFYIRSLFWDQEMWLIYLMHRKNTVSWTKWNTLTQKNKTKPQKMDLQTEIRNLLKKRLQSINHKNAQQNQKYEWMQWEYQWSYKNILKNTSENYKIEMNQQQIRGYKIMDQWSGRQSSANNQKNKKKTIYF